MPPTPGRARFGRHLRELRTAASLTQADVGAVLHVSADAVATWERGRSLPDHRAAQRLDAALHAGGELVESWHAAQADRPTVGRAVGLSAVSLLRQAALEAAEFGTWAERTDSGEVTITALTLRARELATAALTATPAEVVGSAAQLNREAFGLLRGHHKPRHARDLYQVAGLTCALLAWLSGDLGALDAAKMHGSAAQVCADHADEPELSAWVAVVRSKTAFWAGDYRAAAELARAGLALDAPGTAGVMLACQQADAYGKLGAVDVTERALARADAEAERVRGVDTIGGLFSCGPARHANYASGSRLALGAPAGALAEADRALSEFAADGGYGFGTVAQVHVTRVLAHVAAGDVDGAALASRPVLDLPAPRRLATLTERLRPLAQVLGRPSLRSSTVGAPLRAEIMEFCGAPGPRALPVGMEADA